MIGPSITIVDYGVGNLNSVANMIRRAGANPIISRAPEELRRAERLLLPGVGAFDNCRQSLNKIHGLEAEILEAIDKDVPLLGICVGMQMLATSSEEGIEPGLNIIPGRVRRFDFQSSSSEMTSLRVPHMAWCPVEPRGRATLLKGELSALNRFYFVHSYHFECDSAEDCAGIAYHGCEFTAAVERRRVYGVQFHPEKSHRYGLALFRNFASLPVGGVYV